MIEALCGGAGTDAGSADNGAVEDVPEGALDLNEQQRAAVAAITAPSPRSAVSKCALNTRRPVARTSRPPAPGPGFSSEKAWILSAAASTFL